MRLSAYLQHGKAGGPYRTESVEIEERPMSHHANLRLTWTASGYGARIPTPYMVKWLGRWRRVYAACFSNVASHYIRTSADSDNGGRIFVSIERG